MQGSRRVAPAAALLDPRPTHLTTKQKVKGSFVLGAVHQGIFHQTSAHRRGFRVCVPCVRLRVSYSIHRHLRDAEQISKSKGEWLTHNILHVLVAALCVLCVCVLVSRTPRFTRCTANVGTTVQSLRFYRKTDRFFFLKSSPQEKSTTRGGFLLS